MSKFLRGVATGVSQASGLAIESIIEQRRQTALLELSNKYQVQMEGMRNDNENARADKRQKFEGEQATEARKAAVELNNADNEASTRNARIGADSRLAAIEARMAGGGASGGARGADKPNGKIIYEDIVDATGAKTGKRPAWVEGFDSQGNPTVIAYDEYEALLGGGATKPAGSGLTDLAAGAPAALAAVAPRGGLQALAAAAPPLMVRGAPVVNAPARQAPAAPLPRGQIANPEQTPYMRGGVPTVTGR